jgi:HSP20 family protein
VIETKDTIEVRLELPGLCKEEIDIQVSNGVLTIKGEKKEAKEEKVEKRYHHREMRYGSFVRSIALPVDVKAEEASAQCRDGVLSIVLPKEDRAIHKKIEIQG